jgi:hypothetical protein
MTQIMLSPNGTTITVFVHCVRAHGLAPARRAEGHRGAAGLRCDWAPPPKIDHALVKALARGRRWQRMLESGESGRSQSWRLRNGSAARISAVSCASPCSPPIIVERILDGRPTAGLARLLQPFPVVWEKQLNLLC